MASRRTFAAFNGAHGDPDATTQRLLRAVGVNMHTLTDEEAARLDEGARTQLRCYRHQWFHEESWGRVERRESGSICRWRC